MGFMRIGVCGLVACSLFVIAIFAVMTITGGSINIMFAVMMLCLWSFVCVRAVLCVVLYYVLCCVVDYR